MGIKLVALKAEDVLPPGTPLHENAQVTFFIYSDSYMNNKVFGAEKCMKYKADILPASRKEKEVSGVKKPNFNNKPSEVSELEEAMAWMWQASGGKGNFNAFMHSMGFKGKGGGKGRFGPGTGGDLQRERITSELISGTVVRWGARYGHVKPDLPFEHPAISSNGHIYINKKDIKEGTPTEGAAVAFHV